MKYYYPTIFQPTEEGHLLIVVPDLDGCISQGDNLEDAMYMAKDAINCWLDEYEEKDYPNPSGVNDIDKSEYPNSFVSLVEYDPNDFKYNHNQNAEYTESYSEGQAALSV